MFYRAKQFFAALFAQLNTKDKHYVLDRLNPTEQQLFFRMDVADQRHCLDVAYTLEDLLNHSQDIVDKNILIKAGLLHDAGKMYGKFKLWHRVAIVILQAVSEPYWDKLSSSGKGKNMGNVLHTFYIYREHPRLGAELLEQVGINEQIVQLVSQHHLKNMHSNQPELSLLIMADELN